MEKEGTWLHTSKCTVSDFEKKRWETWGQLMTCVLSVLYTWAHRCGCVSLCGSAKKKKKRKEKKTKTRQVVNKSESLVGYLSNTVPTVFRSSLRKDRWQKCHHVASCWWPANLHFCTCDEKLSLLAIYFLFLTNSVMLASLKIIIMKYICKKKTMLCKWRRWLCERMLVHSPGENHDLTSLFSCVLHVQRM